MTNGRGRHLKWIMRQKEKKICFCGDRRTENWEIKKKNEVPKEETKRKTMTNGPRKSQNR